MSEKNIYNAPKSDLTDKDGNSSEFYITVAKRQKHLIYTFAVYIIATLIIANINDDLRFLLRLFIGIPIFLVLIVLNARLCWKIYGTLGRFIMIPLGIIPLVNFLVIFIASVKANKILKKAGFEVGFMGGKVIER